MPQDNRYISRLGSYAHPTSDPPAESPTKRYGLVGGRPAATACPSLSTLTADKGRMEMAFGASGCWGYQIHLDGFVQSSPRQLAGVADGGDACRRIGGRSVGSLTAVIQGYTGTPIVSVGGLKSDPQASITVCGSPRRDDITGGRTRGLRRRFGTLRSASFV